MRLTRKSLKDLIMEEIVRASLLSEAEKDDENSEAEGEDASAAETLFGDEDKDKSDEGDGDEDGKEDSEPDSAEEEPAEEPKDDSVTAEEAEEREEDAEEEGALRAAKSLGKVPQPVALALRNALDDAENSIKNISTGDAVVDHLSRIGFRLQESPLSRLLFETDEDLPNLDIPMYAQKVANLITNYHTLLDMEKLIFDAAYSQLKSNPAYGNSVADEFRDILARDYDIEFDHIYDPEKEDQTHYAVGARGSEGA